MHEEWAKKELNLKSKSYYNYCGYNKERSKKYRDNRSEYRLEKNREYKRT